ncbi:MAG: hypothetical protein HY961_11630 [Ignavibacteriae bacterium]|nr:hypothetical protein [Ignavibacteriota bacterium]
MSVLMLSSCGTSKQENLELPPPGQKAEDKSSGITHSLPLPPNVCRVTATVIQIEKPTTSSDKDPCSKAPCSATIRIDSVHGYGAAFPKTLSPNEQLKVKFTYTLSSTAGNMPEVKPALPGLSTKSRFVANVIGLPTMGTQEPTFTIYGYEKISN